MGLDWATPTGPRGGSARGFDSRCVFLGMCVIVPTYLVSILVLLAAKEASTQLRDSWRI